MYYRKLFKLLTLILPVSLQGCYPILWPNISHSTEYTNFAFSPHDRSPWLKLNNGLDLYGLHRCYISKDTCNDLQLIARPTGQKADWNQILASANFQNEILSVGGHFRQPDLFAYQNTSYRVLGINATSKFDRDTGKNDLYLIRPETGDSESRPKYASIRSVDIWHNDDNWTCAKPVMRFVIFDDQHVWIFAEDDVSCPMVTNDYFAPDSVMKLEGMDKTEALLKKPMRLFYLDFARKRDADFQQPRVVVRDTLLADKRPRQKIAIGEIALPKGKFEFEAGTFQRDIVNPTPSIICRYSDTQINLSLLQSKNPENQLRDCQPYSDEEKKSILRNNPDAF